MGSVSKIWVIYKTPFWRNKGLNALIVCPDEIFTSTFDGSPETKKNK